MLRITQVSTGAMLIATALVAAPTAVDAQEPEAPAACTATVNLEAVPAGEAATQVAFSFSENVGEVTGMEGGESGLRLSSPEDLERVEMATDEETPQAIEMSAEYEGTAIIWLNTIDAQAGTYEVHLVGDQGACAAQITIGEGA